MRIPTPIPKSVARWFMNLLRGGLFDILWFFFITTIVVGLAYLLAQLGVVGAVIASVLIGSLINDNVRAFVRDVYTRNFWGVKV